MWDSPLPSGSTNSMVTSLPIPCIQRGWRTCSVVGNGMRFRRRPEGNVNTPAMRCSGGVVPSRRSRSARSHARSAGSVVLELVFDRSGSRVAPLPELLDEFLALGLTLQSPEGRALRIGDDIRDVIVKPHLRGAVGNQRRQGCQAINATAAAKARMPAETTGVRARRGFSRG